MTATIKNIWTLNKDPSIKSLLILLQHEIGPENFSLLNESELNEKAVRIIYPPTQVYLSAYIYSYAQAENHYGVDLEFPYLISAYADDQSIRLENLSAEQVLQKVIAHLKIKLPD